jgi:hypothetical protein
VYKKLLAMLKKRIIAFLVPIRMTPNAVKKIEQFDELGGFTKHPFGQIRDEDTSRDLQNNERNRRAAGVSG